MVPRLAQSHVCDSVLVAEGKLHVAEGIEGAAIESDVLSQCLENERALVETGFCFSRHVMWFCWYFAFSLGSLILGLILLAFDWWLTPGPSVVRLNAAVALSRERLSPP